MSRPELHERAEELERRLADTGEFVERRWDEIELREAQRRAYEARMEAELTQARMELRFRRLKAMVTMIILLLSATLILVSSLQLLLGSISAALLSGLGSLGTYFALLSYESGSAHRRRPWSASSSSREEKTPRG